MSTNGPITVRIARAHRPAAATSFTLTLQPGATVLDALEQIRVTRDETLLYRHSCHHGSCGTCGMMINGEPRLACTTRVDDLEIDLKPLPTMTPIGDLAVDPTPLFDGFPVPAAYIRESETNRDGQRPEQADRWERFEDCIECGLCVAACPVTQRFVGPAVLAGYNREIENHPERENELLPQVDTDHGVWACDRALRCSAVCPTGVYPARHIAILQRKIKKG